MPSQKHVLTPEQLALSAERKRRKAEASASASASSAQRTPNPIFSRSWLVSTGANPSDSRHKPSEQTTIMSWNMLAQCLVRRELFPTSDCLKASQRENMIFHEITTSGADVICLQEVDRLEKLGPVLSSAGYSFAYSSGPRKKHGCAIAFRTDVYKKVAEQTVFYDEAELHSEGPTAQFRKGSSFRTRNIGFIIALERLSAEDQHIIVATTHLFWHPRYTYERARQALVLTHSVCEFKEKNNLQASPSFLAGDFNFNPSDAAYSLLVGDPLTPQQAADIEASRVVHVSIDPSIPVAGPKQAADDDEESGEVEQKNDTGPIIKNARQAGDGDGLLAPWEFEKQFAQLPTLRSAYDEWGSVDEKRIFASREIVPADRRGRSEPMYTSYTHYWKTTLDYIFVMLPPGRTLKVVAVLEPLAKEDFGAGLPRKGVCGSDHVALLVKIAWPTEPIEGEDTCISHPK
ncbi:Endonuclease/exonuclease/phosphatase [Phellopilus nigrolimitatus]|nr:Endonuclease/exonuclease/phosphatase [Phellopilus nigrolimitatus]